MRTALLVSLSFASLFACGPSVQNGAAEPNIELRVDPTTVRAGSQVELVLSNDSPATIGYNLCTSTLERRSDGGWVQAPSDRVCTMELRTLPAGETVRYPYDIPGSTAAGEYRFVASVELMEGGGRQSLTTGPFTIRR
jgi:hypothetical protein